MHIAIGCDHRGLKFKQAITKLITDTDHSYEDFGCYTTDSVDYPDIAQKVAEAIVEGNFECGILICDTGIGMSMAANKVKGVRAAVCYTTFNAVRTRRHNDANILCLGAGEEQEQQPASEIVGAFLTTKFEGGRHQSRVDKIRGMED
ncbi:ribose 5-phosphate isomerase B [Chloroflexota bacterium]